MLAILLSLLTRGVLSEEDFDHLRKVMERARWEGVKPVRGRTFLTGREGEAHDWIIVGVDHHLISEVTDMLGVKNFLENSHSWISS